MEIEPKVIALIITIMIIKFTNIIFIVVIISAFQWKTMDSTSLLLLNLIIISFSYYFKIIIVV